jgi:hypothetical protein
VTQAEDTYEASVQFGNAYIRPIHSTRSVPGWLTFGAGLLLGIGVTAVLDGFLVQKRRPAPIGT